MKTTISLLLILFTSIIIPVFSQTKSLDSIGNDLPASKELVHEISFPGEKKADSLIIISMNPEVTNLLGQGRGTHTTFYIIGGLTVILGAVIIYFFKKWENKKLNERS
mgnify:CR=1 FL=1